jgi:catechol 2,3-dioxygenase-like lactoylglutathione lyase family enzyme
MALPLHDVHHLGLTVADVDVSAAWYERVLGFRRTGGWDDPAGRWRKAFLAHDGLRARLGLAQHTRSSADAFDETRTGLDHLAFGLADRAELDAWCEHLTAQGVPFSAPAASNSIAGAVVVVFRDPDNIQLELFADPAR